jgi:uncharacterized protein
MVTLKQINEFIASEPIAMVGVSRDPKKFGFAVFRELREKGLNVIPVNPHGGEIHQAQVYPDLKSLPSGVKGLIVVTPAAATAGVVKEARELGYKQIWIQQKSESKEAVAALAGSDINLITGQCILMYYKPHSFHKFHAGIKRFFGGFPK